MEQFMDNQYIVVSEEKDILALSWKENTAGLLKFSWGASEK